MRAEERRKEILQILRGSNAPVPGAQLAERLSVSRQIIVQDVAMLKNSGYDILSTHTGYTLSSANKFSKVLKVCHTDESMQDELNTIVDLGGFVADVFIKHRSYGTIRVPLHIRSRRDVEVFLESIESGQSTPLKNITSNYHYHTIEASSEEILQLIENALSEKNMIASLLDYELEDIG
ncbi:MAG: transcription repressor NadR [Actinobacteria bacterium]|nr:transcription repressor NadR [Actinomycetota bacterium]